MRLVLVLLLPTCAFAQWQMQHSHTKESLRGVSVVNANIVWASGTHGTYILTTDGGKTWTPHQVPGAEDLDFRGVKAFGTEAFLLSSGTGDKSRIYHTADFGQHWELRFTNPEPKGFFDCMAFSDTRHGIAVGDPVNGKFEILRTDNGGKNWRPADVSKMPAAIDGEGAFAASNSCITARGKNIWFATGGQPARVFRSHDGGTSWTAAETPIMHGSPSQGSFSIAFKDALHGIVVGGDYAHPEVGGGNLATTNDGGATWHLLYLQPQKFFSAVAYVSGTAHHGAFLTAGTTASALSADDVRSWLFFVPTGFNAIGIADGAIYAVGASGSIAKLAREK